MMFQDASLYPWMTVRENAALGLLFAGVKKKAAQGGAASNGKGSAATK